MPDPMLDQAIREAMASAPVGEVLYDTLEFHHPTFTVPIRVVLDEVALDARLEATAPLNSGESVAFIAYAFEFIRPEVASAVPQATLEIDNVDRMIGTSLDAATRSGQPVQVIYRLFSSLRAATGPDYRQQLELKTASVSLLRVRATLGFFDLLNQVFPSREYSLERFPGLAE